MSETKRSKPKNQPQDGTVVQFPTTTEPFSLEAEQSILGGLMFNDSEWSLVQAILSAEDFYLPEHRIIFTAIKSVTAKVRHPDPITLTDHLQAENKFKTIGGNDYLSTLTKTLQQNSAASNLIAYARIVRKHSLLRQKEAAYNNRRPAAEIQTIEDALILFENPDGGDKSMPLTEFRQQEIMPREIILDPILATHSETIVYAEPGVGKTLFITDLAFAIACGGHAIKWPVPKSRNVLIVDGEMPKSLLVERYNELVERNNGLEPEKMRIVSALDYNDDMDLIKPEWQAIINNIIEKHQIEVLFLDNLSALFNLDQVKQQDWTPAKTWLKRLRNMGLAIVLAHHANRQKTIFGTSALSRQPDNIIALLRPEDYSQEEGAVFDVRFDKARGLFGDDIAPFRALLNEYGWQVEESVLSMKGIKGAIIDAISNGTTHRKAIADELGKSLDNIKGYLSRMTKDKIIKSVGKGHYELVVSETTLQPLQP